MDHDPKIQSWLHDLYGTSGSDVFEPREDPVSKFFEKVALQNALGRTSTTVREPYREPPAVNDFREFVKAEKQKVASMTTRQIRSSAVQLLRKAADALAAI